MRCLGFEKWWLLLYAKYYCLRSCGWVEGEVVRAKGCEGCVERSLRNCAAKKKNVESQGGQLDRLCSRDANFFKVCYWTRMSVSALLVPIFRITRNSVSAALSAKVMMNLWVSLAASRCPERLQDRLAISKEKYFHATGSQRFFFHYPFLLPSKLK